MNLILLFPEDFVDERRVRLADYRASHIREILKAGIGKVLKVGLVNGGVGDGKVTSEGKTFIELDVEIVRGPAAPPDVSLIVALPRPQTLKKVLEVAGAIGVKRLMLVDAARVEKSFFDSKLLKDRQWLQHLKLGMEQGEKTYLPEVSLHPSLPRFLATSTEGALRGRLRRLGRRRGRREPLRLIADPEAEKTLWETPLAQAHPRHEILCAVGPEGGWLPEEAARFVENGFQPVRLGSSILRVENAVCALLAEIELLQMRFLTER
jgi:RsmE family RNA methyltransferase